MKLLVESPHPMRLLVASPQEKQHFRIAPTHQNLQQEQNKLLTTIQQQLKR